MDETKEEIKTNKRKVVKISRKKFKTVIITTIIVLVILVIVSFVRVILPRLTGTDTRAQSVAPSIPQDYYNDESDNKMMVQSVYPGENKKPFISDTREFLKTSYSATIKTRDVKNVVQEVTNIVKGSDGRIDSSDSSEKYGRISFVIPKSKFESFKDQIENITHKKLYTDNISSQNLLSQKQEIEKQTNNIVSTLENLQNQKIALDTKHTQTVSLINKELTSIKNELALVRKYIADNLDNVDQTVVTTYRNRENSLISQQNTQKQKLTSENNSYAIQSQNLDNSIGYANNNLTNINKQDSQFTDNIETVNGYVNVAWINLWEMAKIFSPVHPTIIIIILILIIGWYLKRKEKIPRVEFQ